MKNIKYISIVLLVLLSVSNVSYAGYGTGKITSLYVHEQGGTGEGVVMFRITQHLYPPSCSKIGDPTEWAFSLAKQSGRAMYALLLSAEARSVNVNVVGYGNNEDGNCDAWGDRERPKFIRVTHY